ncbi:MAG: hypothetical protein WAS21_18270 [Geminicoccaceae bacterium]
MAPEFLIAHGGPFYELQARLGLLHQDALNAGRRALIAVALAWGVPLFWFLLLLAVGATQLQFKELLRAAKLLLL